MCVCICRILYISLYFACIIDALIFKIISINVDISYLMISYLNNKSNFIHIAGFIFIFNISFLLSSSKTNSAKFAATPFTAETAREIANSSVKIL